MARLRNVVKYVHDDFENNDLDLENLGSELDIADQSETTEDESWSAWREVEWDEEK
jgi:hypothetical protein